MRILPLMPLLAAVTACGSNVPPTPEQQAGGMARSRTATTGDQDRDFAAMMIEHHQGAIDMARQELARGRDPQMRELAGKVVTDQQREIARMQEWLERRGGSAQQRAQ